MTDVEAQGELFAQVASGRGDFSVAEAERKLVAQAEAQVGQTKMMMEMMAMFQQQQQRQQGP